MPIVNRLAEMHSEITEWRHDFHRHPELLFDVHRTAGIVANRLRQFGCDEVVEGIGRTGVVGLIKGRETKSGRTLGLRADMDALPIQEASGVAHASLTPGKMHACGHDGHTAMLLGAAQYLAETRNFDGTVAVIFQPAEEGGGGGREMVEDGMMDRFEVDEVYGMHNFPGLPVGQFAIRTGPLMAAADRFDILVTGKGGHAARPHQCVDTTLVAAQIMQGVQSIVARNVDPVESAVISITQLQSDGEAYNVIPQTVRMKGTVRTLAPHIQDLCEARLKSMVPRIAEAFGAEAEIAYRRDYPVTVNAAQQTDYAAEVAERVAGEGRVNRDAPPLLGSEDFSFMLNARPGAFIFVGNGDSAGVHHPAYDFNDAAIPYGCSYWAQLAEARLPL